MLTLSVVYRIPPSEVPDRFTASDFAYLAAYSRLNPFGPMQDTRHAAGIASAALAAGGVSVPPADVFPSLRRDVSGPGWGQRFRDSLPVSPFESKLTTIPARIQPGSEHGD